MKWANLVVKPNHGRTAEFLLQWQFHPVQFGVSPAEATSRVILLSLIRMVICGWPAAIGGNSWAWGRHKAEPPDTRGRTEGFGEISSLEMILLMIYSQIEMNPSEMWL